MFRSSRSTSTTAAGVSIALAELGNDVLDAGVRLHAVDGHVLAVAGLLEAAVRHLGREREQVLVDPHRAEREPPRGAERAADVLAEHRRGKPVTDAVGHPNRLVVAREPL